MHRHGEINFDQTKIYLSVAVQKMVRSDLGTSGVMFSLDTETGFRNVVLINAAYGLGENVVQGAVNPDEFLVFKATLDTAKNPVISKNLGSKLIKKIYATPSRLPLSASRQGERSSSTIKDVAVAPKDRRRFCITDKQAAQLAKWAVIIEKHYKKPMDMEWAQDGRTGKLYIVQARPETIQARRDLLTFEEYSMQGGGKPLVTGVSVGAKWARGARTLFWMPSRSASSSPAKCWSPI